MPKRTYDGPTRRSKRHKCAGSYQASVYADFVLRENEIRILLLEPAPHLEDPIICDLRVVSLRRKPMFDALSYTWGPPVEGIEIPDACITVCGVQRHVKGNLSHALRRLRLENKSRRLWVDALCINQANHVERSQQVAIMARIFGAAEVVHIWLGEDLNGQGDSAACMSWLREVYRYRYCYEGVGQHLLEAADGVIREIDLFRGARSVRPQEDSEDFLRSGCDAEKLLLLLRGELVWMRSVSRNKSDWPWNTPRPEGSKGPDDEDVWNKLVSFFSKSYFRRRWVLQEIHHARYAEVRCGSETIAYAHMLSVFEFVASLTINIRAQRLHDACPALSYLKQVRGDNVKGIGHLLRIFSQVSISDCGDERDRIYALLGLVEQTTLRPNYSLSTNETWIEVAKAAIQEGMAESIIACAACQVRIWSRSRGLPSWVPDFGIESSYGSESFRRPTLQFSAFVDAQNRLTCDVRCMVKMMFRNGSALLKAATGDAVIGKLMNAQSGSDDGCYDSTVSSCLHEDALPKFTVTPSIELKEGDLVCRDVGMSWFIISRTVPHGESDLDSGVLDWVVIGEFVEVVGKSVSRSFEVRRRVRLV